MFRRLLSSQNVAARLLGRLGGERSLTNVLHLMELLNTELTTRRMNMFDTLSWFMDRCARAQGSAAADEELVRLESDTNRVQIITVHKSKGLQFPVVFCPFMAEDRSAPRDGEEVQYHDPLQEYQRVVDLNPDSRARYGDLMEDELQAEALRLLYVALTRAVHRCYIGYGAIKGFERSALAYVLHQQPGEQRQWRAVAARLADEPDERLRSDILSLCARCGQSAMLQPLPRTSALYEGARVGGAGELTFRTLGRAVPRSWKVTSYSALTHVHGHGDEPLVREPERTDTAVAVEEAPADSIFAFPRGALAGTMLHAIFEQIDFTAPVEQIAATVDTLCVSYGFDSSWGPVLLQTIRAVLEAPLPHSVPLRTIAPPQRLVEMEFYFPLEQLDAGRLNGVLGAMASDHPAVAAGIPFGFECIRGFMKGFIDLVFFDGQRYYIADYKSNYLGPHSSFYTGDALLRAMCESRYGLQYAIYSVALHRYLATRLADYDYQRHFGGVYYLFLRGIEQSATDCRGIFYDRMSRAHVEALSDCFGQAGGQP
jgi:exodeoxyribonuclease V beta subunit